MDAPFSNKIINYYNSSFNPSQVHARNTGLVNYFKKYLLEKIFSLVEIEGFDTSKWAYNFYLYVQFCLGTTCWFLTDKYGLIFQDCGLSGYDVFYQPSKAYIRNPLLKTMDLKIGEECEIVKLQPNYSGVMDIVNYYAEMLALCTENASLNLVNSKLAYVFTAQNKSSAEAFKKMFDKIASGEPMVVQDRRLLDENGKQTWDVFAQNLSQNYIADKILDDMKKWEDKFNTEIGIPNANTQKKERMITDEVLANNIDTISKIQLWIDTMNIDFEKVNNMFGTNLKVKYKYESEVLEDDNNSIDSNV